MYCPGEYCHNREKWEPLGGYETTPRSIYGFGKCGAWLFVHKLPFLLQEHLKTTKKDKTRFFFAKKTEFVTRQTIVQQDPVSEQFPTNHSHQHQKELKWVRIWNKPLHFLFADDLSNLIIFQIILFTFNLQSTAQIFSTCSHITENYDLLNLQQRILVDSCFWCRLRYYCSKWSRPKNNNQLTRNIPSCLAIAAVSEARNFGESLGSSSQISQRTRNNCNERRSTLQCEGSRLGH